MKNMNSNSTDSKQCSPHNLVSFTTALAIVPPTSDTECWHQLSDLRYRCKDKGFYRWPPHINLLYPFLDSSCVADVIEDLAFAISSVDSFQVYLSSMGTFGGRKRGVCWLNPATDIQAPEGPKSYQAISDLHRVIAETLGLPHDKAYRPHLTFTHCPNVTTANDIISKESETWNPISFLVKEIYVMERTASVDQYRIIAKIPLKGEIESGDLLPQLLLSSPERFSLMPDAKNS